MPAHFEVGEIAILIQDKTITKENYLCYDLEECEIMEPLGEHSVIPNESYTSNIMFGYTVMLRDGKVLVCQPHELRKKKRPGDNSAWAIEKTKQLIRKLTTGPSLCPSSDKEKQSA